jgi:hypothetical protein
VRDGRLLPAVGRKGAVGEAARCQRRAGVCAGGRVGAGRVCGLSNGGPWRAVRGGVGVACAWRAVQGVGGGGKQYVYVSGGCIVWGASPSCARPSRVQDGGPAGWRLRRCAKQRPGVHHDICRRAGPPRTRPRRASGGFVISSSRHRHRRPRGGPAWLARGERSRVADHPRLLWRGRHVGAAAAAAGWRGVEPGARTDACNHLDQFAHAGRPMRLGWRHTHRQ